MRSLCSWIVLGAILLTGVSLEDIPPAVENLNEGESLYLAIFQMLDVEKCSLETPDGEIIEFKSNNESTSKFEFLPDIGFIKCRANVNNVDENDNGVWKLHAEFTSGNPQSRSYNLTVTPRQVTTEISELLVEHLPTQNFDTSIGSIHEVTIVEEMFETKESCSLLTPSGKLYNFDILSISGIEVISDTDIACGIKVNVKSEDLVGQWTIIYSGVRYSTDNIEKRLQFIIRVEGAEVSQALNLAWVRDRPVQAIVGPESAVYCRIENPQGFTVSDGFGRCNITLDRASTEHSGTWKMSVGLSGQVLTDDSVFTVNVVEAEAKPVVTTSVVANKPTVSLSCSVSSPYALSSCKFRDPSGRVLLANEGVGESRYTFHGAGVSYQSGLHTHDCGLLITDPANSDLGLWRCALDTESETYYGFLSVLCPFAMRDPEVAAEVITDPILTTEREAVSSVVGDSVTMSCSVQSAIRYCYFRARNGTVYSVGPENPHELATYVGAGFDAGECGIRFQTLSASDSGAWSCHVGFPDFNEPEQRARIDLVMHDPITVVQHMDHARLVVEAQVYNNRELEYCRFVRIDGLGFVGGSTNMLADYTSTSTLSTGKCGISIRSPTMLDHHPWTIVAKIRGQDVEISSSTSHSYVLAPVEEIPDDIINEQQPGDNITIYYGVSSLWLILMAVGLMMIFIAAFFVPKRNRDWTVGRAKAVRNSFSRKAVPNDTSNTPVAA